MLQEMTKPKLKTFGDILQKLKVQRGTSKEVEDEWCTVSPSRSSPLSPRFGLGIAEKTTQTTAVYIIPQPRANYCRSDNGPQDSRRPETVYWSDGFAWRNGQPAYWRGLRRFQRWFDQDLREGGAQKGVMNSETLRQTTRYVNGANSYPIPEIICSYEVRKGKS